LRGEHELSQLALPAAVVDHAPRIGERSHRKQRLHRRAAVTRAGVTAAGVALDGETIVDRPRLGAAQRGPAVEEHRAPPANLAAKTAPLLRLARNLRPECRLEAFPAMMTMSRGLPAGQAHPAAKGCPVEACRSWVDSMVSGLRLCARPLR